MSKILIAFLAIWLSSVYSRPNNDVQITAPTKESGGEEKIVGKILVFNHMRNLIHKFDYIYGLQDQNVFVVFRDIMELDVSEIPPTIDQKNYKEMISFQRRYRMCYAILLTSKDGDVTTFKEEVKNLTQIDDDKKIAILVAQFFCSLSKFGQEETDDEVDWNNENESIDALERWGIVNSDILSTARAFHRLKTQIVSKCKKIYIHTTNVEEDAMSQFDECVSKDFVLEAVLMPDAHSGYVAPIGSVIKTKNTVVPAWVGYDIGCGMTAVKISDDINNQNLIREKAHQIFDLINRDIPMGAGGHNNRDDKVYLVKEMEADLKILKKSTIPEYEKLYDKVHEKSRPNLGTLGSGNHFIEISVNGDETWLVIHSGSRGVGHFIGLYFMKAASGSRTQYGTYSGKGYEDTHAIKDPVMLDQYMSYQDYCLKFALLNRLSMALKVKNAIKRITNVNYDTNRNLWTNKNHNHCVKLEDDVFLHRKGATASAKGERGVIPGSMKDGCYLVEGLGNDKFLFSSSHGAGRQMSRDEANKDVTIDQFQDTMRGIVAPVNAKTIDESPFAYKNITGVMKMQRDSVRILKHLKPIINWKGY